ncbi:MAG: FHA domain-containing protein [Lachnospiraceae bacterium]|nr:FHA domain-containing protein [Lachnospiraceae bacterium]
MHNFTIENDGLRTWLEFKADKECVIDAYGLGVILNNRPEWLAAAYHDEEREVIRYDISDMINLSEYLKEGVRLDNIFGIFDNIVCAITQAEKYLLDISMFCLNIQTIFVGKMNHKVKLIYLPATMGEKTPFQQRVNSLFREILIDSKYSDMSDAPGVLRIINYLNNNNAYFVKGVLELIEDIKQQSVFSYESVQMPADMVREHPVRVSASSENTARKSNGRHLFKNIFESIFTSGESDDTCEDNHVEKISNIYNMADLSNTCEIEVPVDTQYPYLIRKQGNEKIAITKNLFCIGKEERYADYIISDNAAVSRMQAEITKSDGDYFITDQDSLNHTYVNGNIISPYVPIQLKNGDRICFADDEYEFCNVK